MQRKEDVVVVGAADVAVVVDEAIAGEEEEAADRATRNETRVEGTVTLTVVLVQEILVLI